MANMKLPSSDMLEAVLAFLNEEEWEYEATDTDPATLRTRFEGDNGSWSCYALIFTEEREVVVYSVFPVDAPEHLRSAMMERITLINLDLNLGNFQIDLDDGEVLFKTSLSVENEQLSIQLVRNLVFANVGTMDEFFLGLSEVLYGPQSLGDSPS